MDPRALNLASFNPLEPGSRTSNFRKAACSRTATSALAAHALGGSKPCAQVALHDESFRCGQRSQALVDCGDERLDAVGWRRFARGWALVSEQADAFELQWVDIEFLRRDLILRNDRDHAHADRRGLGGLEDPLERVGDDDCFEVRCEWVGWTFVERTAGSFWDVAVAELAEAAAVAEDPE